MTEAITPIQIIGEPTLHFNIADRESSLVMPENRFYIPGEIKSDNLQGIIKGLRKLEQEKPGANVLMEINSTGGDIGATIELALVMHNAALRITTLTTNKAYSAATALAAAGDKGLRFAYPQSDFMIHPSTYTVNGKFTLKELTEERDKKARAEDRYTSLLAMLTGNPQERIQELFGGDNYFTAEEARELGVIDHILSGIKPR